MSTGRHNRDIKITQATIGVEVELKEIRFVLINRKVISYVKGNDVLPIAEATDLGVEVVQDNKKTSDFFSALESIANNKKLTITKKTNLSHIFEFFTHPTHDLDHLDLQFEEIAVLETDLIRYLLYIKKNYPDRKLICVKDWIDFSYNVNPNHKNKIKATENSENMFILVDYSTNQFKLTNHSISKEIQLTTQQYVQFNFVTALRKKMGTFFVTIFYNNSTFNQLKEKLQKLKEDTESSEEKGDYDPLWYKKIETLQEDITNLTKKRDILLQSEKNAEKACNYIRSVYNDMSLHEDQLKEYKLNSNPANRKLIKLEGLFFILSTRILTETTFMIRGSSTAKNNYLFFLKTQLSDLVNCLSLNDKALLYHMNSWSDENKNQLFAYIAGSKWVLTKNYYNQHVPYKVYDVLRSALGWTAAVYCDYFPTASVKTFKHPVEPEGIRRGLPLGRVLFEYRGSKFLTLSEAKKEAHLILKKSSELCKTTHLHKKELKDAKPQQITKVIMNSSKSLEEKKSFIENIKLYSPALLSDLEANHPEILAEMKTYQKGLNDIEYPSEIMDLKIKEAMNLIHDSDSCDNLKSTLFMITLDEKEDHQLNLIDRIYVSMTHTPDLSVEKKQLIKAILKEIYYEVLSSLCVYPLTPNEIEYMKFIGTQFFLSTASGYPQAYQLIHFIVDFHKNFPVQAHTCNNIRESLLKRAKELNLVSYIEKLESSQASSSSPSVALSHSVIFPTPSTTSLSPDNPATPGFELRQRHIHRQH